LPRQSGDAAQTISRELNNALLRCNVALKKFGDEFINPEHLLLGLLQGTDDTAKLLKDAGLTEKGLTAAIKRTAQWRHRQFTNGFAAIQCT